MADNTLHGLLSRVRKLIPQDDECLSCHCVDKKLVSSTSNLFPLELKVKKTHHMHFELIFSPILVLSIYIYVCMYVCMCVGMCAFTSIRGVFVRSL